LTLNPHHMTGQDWRLGGIILLILVLIQLLGRLVV